jgi:hypothetical protein
MFESKKVVGFAESRLHHQFVSCRTKTASSVSLLQNQVCIFISSLAETRLALISAAAEPRHLQFVLCRTNATA